VRERKRNKKLSTGRVEGRKGRICRKYERETKMKGKG
jgi:hypothetical protein